jgi:Fur family ferric uptake transcriptional regulator
MKEKQDLIRILKNANLKATGPRILILNIFSKFKNPKTIQEIQAKIGKNKIDLVTLYRTLASFQEKKLIKRIDMHKDAVYYELNSDHHHHIICTNCGKLEDFKLCDLEVFMKKIISQAEKFKNIKEHSLELFGVCNTCMDI